MSVIARPQSSNLGLIFRFCAVWAIAVSVTLFISLLVRPAASPKPLNMATIIGAPLAFWMMANPYGVKWLRWLAPAIFIAAIAPAMFGWIIFLYLPALPGIFTGLRWR